MMSLVTLVPQAHINTSLTEADNVEAMDKSEWTIWGLQKITQCVQSIRGGWQHPSGLWWVAEGETLTFILTKKTSIYCQVPINIFLKMWEVRRAHTGLISCFPSKGRSCCFLQRSVSYQINYETSLHFSDCQGDWFYFFLFFLRFIGCWQTTSLAFWFSTSTSPSVYYSHM